MMENNKIKVKIIEKNQLSEDVVSLVLEPVNTPHFPAWSPGTHAELELTIAKVDGELETVYRHYSLCGDYENNQQWRIAILQEKEGRGGSIYIHQHLKVGDEIMLSEPKNHFEFKPRKKCIFIAGGIGITPILPMIRKANEMNIDWKLIYTARDRSRLVFVDELLSCGQDQVILNGDKEDGFIDLDSILAEADIETSVYSCGPQRLLDALDEKFKNTKNLWDLKIERFSAEVDENINVGKGFNVVIHSTGEKIFIASGKSILDTLKEKGFKVTSSCKNGICGSCETVVISGIPDHRDSVLSAEEREENETMMICVSRACSEELVLDIKAR